MLSRAPTRPVLSKLLATTLCLLTSHCLTMGSAETEPLKLATGRSALLFCDGLHGPFRWSKQDTRETQDQATEQNAIGRAECGWK